MTVRNLIYFLLVNIFIIRFVCCFKLGITNKLITNQKNSHHYTVVLLAAATGKSSSKIAYVCTECGKEHIQWMGSCSACGEYGTIKEFKVPKKQQQLSSLDVRSSVKHKLDIAKTTTGTWLSSSTTTGSLIKMDTVDTDSSVKRTKVFSEELDRVLGGGLVSGSLILIAGDPGIGKSTLLLQLASSVAKELPGVVYLTGEETAEQITARANRLNLSKSNLYLLCETDVDSSIATILSMQSLPLLVIVDSIQTMRSTDGPVGSVSQIKESTAKYLDFAKSTGVTVLLVGHVTKSGEVAGPRVLEHMVDTVLYMEGSDKADYRLVRSIKNRFGSISEVGVFTMTGIGLTDVSNPSELFLSDTVFTSGTEGSAVAIVLEGTRPILAEIQCLVSDRKFQTDSKINSRRASDGFPIQRLLLLCAVIEKRLKLELWLLL